MSVRYLDENLLLSKDAHYVTDKNFLSGVSYYVKRKCNCERYDDSVEEYMHDRYTSELKDIIDYYVNIFKENYANLLCTNVNSINLEESPYAYDYMSNTYPYCLFKDGMIDTKDLDSALLYFAKHNLNADDSKLENVIPVLMIQSTRVIENFDINNYTQSEGFYRFSDIVGTINPKYQRESLYETLHALDDYDLKKYINYIMVMNGLLNPKRIMVFDPVLFIDNEACYDKLYVVEGNHRLFACKALYEITRLITLNCFDNDKVFYNKSLKKK